MDHMKDDIRRARGYVNRAIDEMAKAMAALPHPMDIDAEQLRAQLLDFDAAAARAAMADDPITCYSRF